MRAAIFNQYLDTLGGGERYTMAVATALVKKGYQVEVEWQDKTIGDKLEKRFDIDLSKVEFVESINRGDNYDFCFWVSDGSIPLLRARKNILHFQFPFKDVNGKSLINRMKMFRISDVICNSKFTKGYIDEEFGIESKVVYPPVSVTKIKPKRKENIILSVGRFSQLAQAKRQDVLVRAFKKLHDTGFSDWRLILAGGTDVGVDDFLAKLKKISQGYPVEIIESPEFSILRQLYGKAKIFWTATGYKVEEGKKPKRVEHFGIAIVEAMCAGAVPLAFEAGGHREIITDGKNGYLWRDIRALLTKTKRIIKEPDLFSKLSRKAIKHSKSFGYERFEKEIGKFI
jgi:glycosyltransferase involved in cell wall biosynthesis